MPNNPVIPDTILSTTEQPLTLIQWFKAVQAENAQVLARAQEIENSLEGLHTEIAGVGNSKVSKSGDTMTGTLNVPQVNANTGVFHGMNVVSQDGNTHVEVSNGGFLAEVTEETTGNKKYGVIAYPNGKVGFYAHDSAHNKDVNFIIPNMDEYEAGTYELSTFTPKVYDCEAMPEDSGEQSWIKRCKLIELAPHVFAIDVLFDCTDNDSGSEYIDVFTDKITGSVDAMIAYDETIGINSTFPCHVTKITNGIRLDMNTLADPSFVYLHGIFTEGE